MSLIVETGSAAADSEAYASVAYCDTYHAAIGNVAWAALDTTSKEQALRRATMYMGQWYRLQWKGIRVTTTQALDWPRYDVGIPDAGGMAFYASNAIPIEVVKANAELALIASTTQLNSAKTQAVVSEQVGPIKVVYEQGSSSVVQYPAVDDVLSPLLKSTGGGNMKLVRV